MFKVKFQDGTVVLPDLFKIKVKKWLGNDKKLLQEIYSQVSVRNVRITPLKSQDPSFRNTPECTKYHVIYDSVW